MSPHDQGHAPGTRRLAPGLLIILCCALCAWAPTLRYSDWTADDPQVVLANPLITGSLPPLSAFTRDYTHHLGDSGQWRPAAALSLRADHALHGPGSSRGWHLSNLLLHLTAVTLAALLAYRVRGRLLVLGVAAYAVHPLLVDSVAWVSGRPALVCVLFGLLGAHLLQTALSRDQRGWAVTLTATASLLLPLLAKEDGAVFALLFTLLAAGKGRSHALHAATGCGLALCLWFAARACALGGAIPAAAHPALAGAPLHERALVGFQAAAEALSLTLAPWNVPPRYEVESLPSVLASLAITGACALLLYLVWRRRPISAPLLILPALAFAPFLHILPAGEVFAPRFAHLALLFSIPLMDDLLRRLKRPFAPLLLLALMALTWRNASTYSDAESYWQATLRRSPSSPVAWNALGLARADDLSLPVETRHEEAIHSFRTALDHAPGHSRAWSNLARSLRALGREDESVAALREALRTGPENPIAHINWARHLSGEGRHEEARDLYLRATTLSPGFAPAWRGLAGAEAALGRHPEAVQAEGRARSLNPD